MVLAGILQCSSCSRHGAQPQRCKRTGGAGLPGRPQGGSVQPSHYSALPAGELSGVLWHASAALPWRSRQHGANGRPCADMHRTCGISLWHRYVVILRLLKETCWLAVVHYLWSR